MLLDICPRNLERILYFALYIVTASTRQREKALASSGGGDGRAHRRAPSRWSRRSAPSSREPSRDKRAEVEAADEAESAATTSASAAALRGAGHRRRRDVEASIKEGGKTVAEDVVFAPTGEVIVRAGETSKAG